MPRAPRACVAVPAARALAVRGRGERLRAGRVVCLRSARLDRADFARQRRRHPISRPAPRMHPNDPARAAPSASVYRSRWWRA